MFFKGCVVAIDEVKQQVSEEKKLQVESISQYGIRVTAAAIGQSR